MPLAISQPPEGGAPPRPVAVRPPPSPPAADRPIAPQPNASDGSARDGAAAAPRPPAPIRPPGGSVPATHAFDAKRRIDAIQRARDASRQNATTNGPPKPATPTNVPKVDRNDPCPCGSGKKYKRCHGVSVSG
jgi:hypothetical protein